MTRRLKTNKLTEKKMNNSFRVDALTCYMNEIREIKPLTRFEELKLGHQIAKGDTIALQKLVQKNLKYVVSVANKYRGCGLSLQDLIEEGNIGLIRAAKKFNPSYEVKFITYAVWWIRQAITYALAAQARTVKLPVKQAAKVHKGRKSFNHLAQVFGREPTQTEIAQHQKIPVKDYENIMRVYQNHISLDAPLNFKEKTTYLELLVKQDAIPYDEQIIKQELDAKVYGLLKALPKRENEILRMRFGFDGEAKTLEAIGQKFGLSRERVRQIEKRAKTKLQNQSKSNTSFDPLD